MNNKGFSKGILFVLFLALTFGWMVSGKWVEASASAPALEYIYTGEDDETGQLVVFAVDTDGEALENAVLYWQTDGVTGSSEATELVDGYAAFLLEDVTLTQENMETLSVTCQGMTYDLDLQAFGQESDVVTASLEEENEEELPLAQDSDEIVSGLAEAEALTEETAGTGSEVVLTPGNGLNRASNDIVIVLDPGHGGWDAGAYRTWNGVTYTEKVITLKIAQYTKAELETYAGVQVYMTRDSDVYVGLQDRVDYAASVGATAIISQHINSTGTTETTATGAEVMVSYGNYKPSQAKETAAIARTILAELESIGFKNRDLVYKLSETGNTYSNGKLADYYAIVRYSVQYGFPGMIVEHGFVSNPSDCLKYYATDKKIKALGVADATAIAKYYGLAKKGNEGWIQENGNWYYQPEGQEERSPAGWLIIGENKYYLDENGYRLTGWQVIGGKTRYFDSMGVMVTGNVSIGGNRYYFNTKGVLKKGFFTGSDGNTYYANKDGVLYHGFKMKNGKKYYFTKTTGKMRKKTWIKVNKKWYYLSKYGYAICNKTKVINGVKYKFDKNGVCLNK